MSELIGCGDNSCLIAKPKGMATNGGCRCFNGMRQADRIWVQKTILALQQENAQLKEQSLIDKDFITQCQREIAGLNEDKEQYSNLTSVRINGINELLDRVAELEQTIRDLRHSRAAWFYPSNPTVGCSGCQICEDQPEQEETPA